MVLSDSFYGVDLASPSHFIGSDYYFKAHGLYDLESVLRRH